MTEPLFVFSISAIALAGRDCVEPFGELRHKPLITIAENATQAIEQAKANWFAEYSPADGWLHEFYIDPWPADYFIRFAEHGARLGPSIEKPFVTYMGANDQIDILDAKFLKVDGDKHANE